MIFLNYSVYIVHCGIQVVHMYVYAYSRCLIRVLSIVDETFHYVCCRCQMLLRFLYCVFCCFYHTTLHSNAQAHSLCSYDKTENNGDHNTNNRTSNTQTHTHTSTLSRLIRGQIETVYYFYVYTNCQLYFVSSLILFPLRQLI